MSLHYAPQQPVHASLHQELHQDAGKVERLNRENLTAYTVGQERWFAGYLQRCIVAGTTGAAEPTIIAPIGAADLINNGGFDADTNWTKGANWTIAAGVATQAAGSVEALVNDAVVVATKSYLTTFTITALVAGTLNIALGTTKGTLRGSASTFAEVVTSNGTAISLEPDVLFSGSVDDVSIVEVTLDGTCAWKTVSY